MTTPVSPPVAPSIPATTPPTTPPTADIDALLGPAESERWWHRWRLGLAALALLAAVGAGYAWHLRSLRAAAPVYSTTLVRRGELTLTVVANGTLQPTRSFNVGSELSGSVLKVNVDVNDTVRKGQVLIELDTAKLRDQVLRSQATLTAALGKVAQTAATVQEARAAMARLDQVAAASGGEVPLLSKASAVA